MGWLKQWLGRPSQVREASRGRSAARLRVERLEDRQVPTVLYYGGNLLTHVEAQALYLGNQWSNVPANAAQTTTVDAFLKDLTGGAYMQALSNAGYGVGTGTASAGAVDNTALAVNSIISDSYIQTRVQADISSGLVQAPDANRLYVVYVEPNVAVNLGFGQGTTQQGILGYHGAFGGRDASGHAMTIRYAVVAYPGGTVGNSTLPEASTAVDQLTDVASHEVAEAATDPDVNYAQLGWYDPRRGEIGDITENNPAAYVRLDGYLVQEVANQNDQLLAINTSPPAPPPSPPPAPPGMVSTTTTLTAGPVHYHWWGPATETLTVTITPGSGTVAPGGTVELIYDGQVLGTAQIHLVNGVATATFNVAYYANGSYSFTAQYMGTSQFQGSTSNSVTVNV
jgi:hypothetical protein